jgi:hypothetical protein
MSHLATGFCVTDIEALALTVKEKCPELELVKQKTYRTWTTDHGGRLVGDYPLPGIYQVKLLASLVRQGVPVHLRAQELGVELPNIMELEKNPWTLAQQRMLLKDATFNAEYEKLCKETVGQDAEFVIRYKKEKGETRAYEIGLIPHPVRKGEYLMMTDFYAQGNGLLNAQGLGKHKSKDDSWGGELKQAYAVMAAERAIVSQIKAGNPEYSRYEKTVLPDGKIKIEVFPRS